MGDCVCDHQLAEQELRRCELCVEEKEKHEAGGEFYEQAGRAPRVKD